MKVVIAKPGNKEQLDAIKAVLKALHVDFITEKDEFNPEFLKKVERAEEQIKSGKYRTITPSEVWK